MKFGHILSLIMSYAGIIFKSVLMSLGKVELGSMTFTYQGQHTFFRVSSPLLPHLPFISKLWRHSQLPGTCMLNSRFSICTVIADVLNSLTVFALCFVEADQGSACYFWERTRELELEMFTIFALVLETVEVSVPKFLIFEKIFQKNVYVFSCFSFSR